MLGMMSGASEPGVAGRRVGRYILYDEIASGGMAAVHLGRLVGPVGFGRTVAIKRLHRQFVSDPEFVAMFLDEAHLAARIQHPNVVVPVDVVTAERELFLVMDYIHGESLSRLLAAAHKRRERVPPKIAVAIVVDVLYGLHAAHQATGENGEPLEIVHRDVSPQNILVGVDGISRVADFGIAKAASRLQTTSDGRVKGKFAYMSPEQLRRGNLDRRTDVFAAAIVLWEALTGKRLFRAPDPGASVLAVLDGPIEPPSRYVKTLPSDLDDVVLRGLAREPNKRFSTARGMARTLEATYPSASRADVGDWVKCWAKDALLSRAESVSEIESSSNDTSSPADAASVEAPTAIVSEPTARPTERPSRARVWLVVSFVVLLAVLASAWRVFRSEASTLHLARLPVISAPPQTASASPSSSTAPSAATEKSRAPVTPAPSSRPIASSHAAPKPTRKPRADCLPPYTWDPVRKIKVYKEHCFQ